MIGFDTFRFVIVECFIIVIILVNLISMTVISSAQKNLTLSSKGSSKIKHYTAVAGHQAVLPCNITPSELEDKMVVVLWYKNPIENPIFWIDTRKGNKTNPKRFVEKDYEGRLYFSTKRTPTATLVINDVIKEDKGVYRCRVDFEISRTINKEVELRIIIPSEKPEISDGAEDNLSGLIGPYNEGHSLDLNCKARGGNPTPTLTWWKGTQLLKSRIEKVKTADGMLVQSSIHLPKLSRKDLHTTLTCQSSNNNVTVPPSTIVTVDLNLNPVDAVIVTKRKPLEASKRVQITCKSHGSRPPAIITWWKNSQKLLQETVVTISNDLNETTSVLTFVPQSSDHSLNLKCRADNPDVTNSAMEDNWKLQVLFRPELTVKLGTALFKKEIREGHDVFFVCNIKANPPVEKATWFFEGKEIEDDGSSNVILREKELVLQEVTRHRMGAYTCIASNSQGRGTSPEFILKIRYPPVCKKGMKTKYMASLHETIEVACEVDAEPNDIKFEWTFNNSVDMPITVVKTKSDKTTSIASYTPRTKGDFGILACSSKNGAGDMAKKCLFRIVYASTPASLHNCSIVNQTFDTIQVVCVEGYDGGLKQNFHLEVSDKQFGTLKSNISNNKEPSFVVKKLSSNREYSLKIYASNDKGNSAIVKLLASTSEPAQMQTVLIPEKNKPKPYKFSPILAILIGIVVSLVFIALIIVFIMKYLHCITYNNSVGKSEKTPDPIHLQKVADSDDKNPDVIPSSTFKPGTEGVKPSTISNNTFHRELGAAVAAYQYGATANQFEFAENNYRKQQLPHLQQPSPGTRRLIDSKNIPSDRSGGNEVTYAELSLPRDVVNTNIRRPTTEYATIDFKRGGSSHHKSIGSIGDDEDNIVTSVTTPLVRLQTESTV